MIAIKCVVWDLDYTLWEGILVEDTDVVLKPGAREVIETLDHRGILQSIASRNDHDRAIKKLKDLGLEEYFLFPQIGWGAKPQSVETIAREINVGLDTFAFVDDDPFEQEQMKVCLPQVRVFDADDMGQLLAMPAFNPPHVTAESSQRRKMYLSEMKRQKAEESFSGPTPAFLATLNMELTLGPAREGDLQRAEELTVRTHQLNTTGRTYSAAELDGFRHSDRHLLLVADLRDRFGSYGKIGLVLVEIEGVVWTLKLFLMSCRVMSRGVGTIILNHLMARARDEGARLRAEFLPTDVNRMMYVTLKFAGFKEKETEGEVKILETNLSRIQPCPPFVALITDPA